MDSLQRERTTINYDLEAECKIGYGINVIDYLSQSNFKTNVLKLQTGNSCVPEIRNFVLWGSLFFKLCYLIMAPF